MPKYMSNIFLLNLLQHCTCCLKSLSFYLILKSLSDFGCVIYKCIYSEICITLTPYYADTIY